MLAPAPAPAGETASPTHRLLPSHVPRAAIRLFVAIYPPPPAASALLRTLDHPALLPALPPHRRTPAEQLHLTLLFLGDTDPRHLDWVTESVDRAAAGLSEITLTPQRLIALPKRPAARLIAIETDAPPVLLELQRRLATRLADPARRSKDRFTPHLTLARFTDDGRGADTTALAAALDTTAPPPAPFAVTHIHLVASRLRPAGAEHAPVHTVVLAG